LHENHRSQIAADALVFLGALYDVETRAREQKLDAIGRQRLRQLLGRPIADSLHQWLILHRQKVPDGSATAKAIDYSLKRWEALIRPPAGSSRDWRTAAAPNFLAGISTTATGAAALSATRYDAFSQTSR
jgi:hypothetical protein